ncbi:hypothetical protein DMUE_4179 [Dictyocoela muelleri]|nr:hypothetical protein DMUE_4179 [Dictyocoela muelleri]
MLHILCRKIRDISPLSNFISSEIKRILLKNKDKQRLFSNVTNLKISKILIITRWGTWLNFMSEIILNYDLYKLLLINIAGENPNYVGVLSIFLASDFLVDFNELKI